MFFNQSEEQGKRQKAFCCCSALITRAAATQPAVHSFSQPHQHHDERRRTAAAGVGRRTGFGQCTRQIHRSRREEAESSQRTRRREGDCDWRCSIHGPVAAHRHHNSITRVAAMRGAHAAPLPTTSIPAVRERLDANGWHRTVGEGRRCRASAAVR